MESSKKLIMSTIVIAIIFSVIHCFVYAMFFYRGGVPSVGFMGYIITIFIGAMLGYSDDEKDRALNMVAAAIIFTAIVALIRDVFLLNLIVGLFT